MKQIMLTATIRNADFILPLDVPDGLDERAIALMSKGYGETLRDATAKFPGSVAEQYGAICERNAKLYDGSYRFGGGGKGGSRLDSDMQAWKEFLGIKKNSDVEAGILQYVAVQLINRGEATADDEDLWDKAEAASEEVIAETEETADFQTVKRAIELRGKVQQIGKKLPPLPK